jgi:hypothetical protein
MNKATATRIIDSLPSGERPAFQKRLDSGESPATVGEDATRKLRQANATMHKRATTTHVK